MYSQRYLLEILFSQVYIDSRTGCWEFTGNKNHNGYGIVGKSWNNRAHRISYQFHYGPIPKGYHVLHKCDNPPCFNPEHLFLGTHQDNMADMANKGRSFHGERASESRRAYYANNPAKRIAQSKRMAAYYRKNPSTILRGNAHPMHLHPELRARGSNHGMKKHPDRAPMGERNGGAKLHAADVMEIRKLYATGRYRQSQLCKQFNVSGQQMSGILNGRYWKHLLPAPQHWQ